MGYILAESNPLVNSERQGKKRCDDSLPTLAARNVGWYDLIRQPLFLCVPLSETNPGKNSSLQELYQGRGEASACTLFDKRSVEPRVLVVHA